jgi:hypothetical protein
MQWKYPSSFSTKKFKVMWMLCLLCFVILREYHYPIFGSAVKMWILHRTVKFCWSFGMQFTEKLSGHLARGVLLHPDNFRPHTARPTQDRIQELQWELREHLPYSPDFSLSDFQLLGPLKKHLGGSGKCFVDDKDVETEMCKWLRQLLCCRFQDNCKNTGLVYRCWLRVCQETKILPGLDITYFSELFNDSLVYMLDTQKEKHMRCIRKFPDCCCNCSVKEDDRGGKPIASVCHVTLRCEYTLLLHKCFLRLRVLFCLMDGKIEDHVCIKFCMKLNK